MITHPELAALHVALENARRQLRQGHIGEALQSIDDADAIVVAELDREDRMWERIAAELKQPDAPTICWDGNAGDDPEAIIIPAATHDVHLPSSARDEPPSRTP